MVQLKLSKSVEQVKKGDKVIVDGEKYEVDAHYLLIDHGKTKEMAIELFNDKDQDFQLRYFNDQMEATIEFYELKDILYERKKVEKIEW